MWYVSHIILCICILYRYNNHIYYISRKQRVQATNREVIRKWRWMKPRFKMVQGVPLQTLTEQVWAISDAKTVWPRNDMRCWLLGKLHRISVSWIQRGHDWGHGYPKIIKKMTCWVRMVVLEGSSHNFSTNRNQLGWTQVPRGPQFPSAARPQGLRRWRLTTGSSWQSGTGYHRLLVKLRWWVISGVGLLQRASRTSGAAPQASKMFSLIRKESSWLAGWLEILIKLDKSW